MAFFVAACILLPIPANAELSGLETEVANDSQKAFLLKNIIDGSENILEKEKFSYIIIDCPPSLSLLTILKRSLRILVPWR